MSEVRKMDKPDHEHNFTPSVIYVLRNFQYIIVQLVCDKEGCHKENWDIGDWVETVG